MSYNNFHNYYMSRHTKRLDYDLFVIDPVNEDSTPDQIRDCIFDALTILDKRTSNV